MSKSRTFKLWESAARFSWDYYKLGVTVRAPKRVAGVWVVRYQLIKG